MKGLGGKVSSEVEPSEEEFLPLSESSRLSLSDNVSVAEGGVSESSRLSSVAASLAQTSPVW